jgi:hypothetical protein
MAYVIRSTERDGTGPVRVTVVTDHLELVRLVVPFRNTSTERLDELVSSTLERRRPIPRGLGDPNG